MKKNIVFFLFSFLSVSVFAQGVTTSYIKGYVKDKDGKGLVGAHIAAVHLPSGSSYGTAAQHDGYFALANMLSGGPYKVTISFIGYKTYIAEGVNLQLAEPFQLNVKLSEEGQALDEVVVLGKEDQLLNSGRHGALTNLGTHQILYSPTITRNLNDLTRFTPQASSVSPGAVGGGNYRQNNITVDGSDFNNSFGLSGGNLPGGGSPISLDALSEISVHVTPFDVRQSGFIGSSVKAVTRSGTNKAEGAVYTYFRNQNQQGNKVGDAAFVRQKMNVNTVGFRLGAPIIKDKVFFFVNTEFTAQTPPGQTNVAATPTNPYTGTNNVARPSAAQLDGISAYLKSKYEYETGGYQGYDLTSKNLRFLMRLDWNINKNHRFNIRYSSTKFVSPALISQSRTPLPSMPVSRIGNNALWFENSNYNQETNFYSLAAELNSRFGERYANTLRFTYTNQDEPRSVSSKLFPTVDILQSNGSENTPFTTFGYEPFSYGNRAQSKTFSVIDNLSFNVNRHLFTLGAQFDYSRSRNGFLPAGATYYSFNSWDDFVNGAKPADFALSYSLLPDFKQAYATLHVFTSSVYGQDEWEVSDKFKLTYGVRLDVPQFLKTPEVLTHPLVAQLSFADNRTIDTGKLPHTPVLVSPRIGFNWDIKGDRSLQLRGGTGIFTGRIPVVYLIAQSLNSGMIQFSQVYQKSTAPGPFNPDINFYRPSAVPKAGTRIPSAVNAMDSNLKYPQTWKASLAADVKLPWGMIGTLEGIVNKDLRTIQPINPNYAAPVKLNNGTGDHRDIFPAANKDKYLNPVNAAGQADRVNANGTFIPTVLINSYNRGYYLSLTARLEKRFGNGLSATAAFTKSYAQALLDGSGSQLASAFNTTAIADSPNTPQLSYAGYTAPNRLIIGGSYHADFFKNLGATLSLFYEGSSAGLYSYTYSNDFNRDGQASNDLLYVPKDASEINFADIKDKTGAVLFTAPQQSDAFFKYVNDDPYLKTRKGQYAERNGAQYPWRGQVDIKLAVDIMSQGKRHKHTLQFTADIFNFGNLLNSKSGTFQLVNSPSLLSVVNQGAFTADGAVKPVFNMALYNGRLPSSLYRDNVSIASTYYMQFGIRYIFN